jgi:hypothetical protein
MGTQMACNPSSKPRQSRHRGPTLALPHSFPETWQTQPNYLASVLR